MKSSTQKFTLLAACAMASLVGFAEYMDRPSGIKFGQRLTLKPYVSTAVTYDSNVEGRSNGAEDVLWTVNPGFGLEYNSEQWSVVLNGYYQFMAHSKSTQNSRDSHSWGEDLTLRWTDSLPSERGWTVMLAQSFRMMNEVDDITDASGNAYNQDRQELRFSGAVERRITDKFHAAINGGYYWLDYMNSDRKSRGSSLYGWDRWMVGGDIGYALSPWTDLLLVGSYQRYNQGNRNQVAYYGHPENNKSRGSDGVTVQGGFGSYATERIAYRVLGGWSNYMYDEGGDDASGFSYSVSGSWTIHESWKTMLLASSQYQPTEREFGSSQRVDMISWGLAHAMIHNKLNASFDVAYRRETREYSATESYDYNLDFLTFRLGLNYILNRYLSLYTNFEYRKSMSDRDEGHGADYDYNRFRGTLGLRFTY